MALPGYCILRRLAFECIPQAIFDMAARAAVADASRILTRMDVNTSKLGLFEPMLRTYIDRRTGQVAGINT